MTSSIKYDDVITKIKMSYIFFDPRQMFYKTAKFGGVWTNTSADNYLHRLNFDVRLRNVQQLFEARSDDERLMLRRGLNHE